ncbi:MAG TPA: hypothetical protein PLO62_05335 [Candidatus Hydrogenedentes bacterium]|nr:hypothetical protein [Candidatus Hydrogenedentota bacterium]HOS02557.1 hypothetical protein [Candidatus Hydrogenedentota bacterium]
MELVTFAEFLEWAERMGLAIETRRDEPQSLVYQSGASAMTRLQCPNAAEDVLQFLADVFDCLDEWKACWVLRRALPWTYLSLDGVVNCVRVDIMQGMGIPEGFVGALHFNQADFPRMAALLFSEICFGKGKADELFVAPSHGRQLLHFKHDACVRIHFSKPERRESFHRDIAAKGIPIVPATA